MNVEQQHLAVLAAELLSRYAICSGSPSLESPSVMLMTMGGKQSGCSAKNPARSISARSSVAVMGVLPSAFGSNQMGKRTVLVDELPRRRFDFLGALLDAQRRLGHLTDRHQITPGQFPAHARDDCFAVADDAEHEPVEDSLPPDATQYQCVDQPILRTRLPHPASCARHRRRWTRAWIWIDRSRTEST